MNVKIDYYTIKISNITRTKPKIWAFTKITESNWKLILLKQIATQNEYSINWTEMKAPYNG